MISDIAYHDVCPALADMLRTNKTVGRSGKIFEDLGSNSTLNNIKFIQRAMTERQPTRTLEVGLAFGASTLAFCFEHQRSGRAGQKQHVAIDPYQPYPLYDESGVYAIERAGLIDYLDYRPEFSEFVLPRLLEAHQRFDFIYVDGSHLFENVFIDAFYCARLLNDGALIAFDDSTYPHVAKAIAFIRTNLSGALKEVPRTADNLQSMVAVWLGRNQLTCFVRVPHTGQHGPRKWDTPLRQWDSKLGRF